jgi:broad specificity phosphatase PhoE
MGAIHLIRHGQASFGTDNYDRLSDLGKRQARVLGEHFRLAGIGFSRVARGQMVRHRQTMDECLDVMGMQATPWISASFNEFDHEEVVARFRPEFADHETLRQFLAEQERPAAAFQIIFDQAMRRWLSGRHDDEYKESWSHFRQRCIDGFQTLLRNAGGSEHIAVFTSGGPVSIIAQHLLGVPDEHVLKLNYAMINASVTRVLYNDVRVSLSSFNAWSHLESAGDPGLVTYR